MRFVSRPLEPPGPRLSSRHRPYEVTQLPLPPKPSVPAAQLPASDVREQGRAFPAVRVPIPRPRRPSASRGAVYASGAGLGRPTAAAATGTVIRRPPCQGHPRTCLYLTGPFSPRSPLGRISTCIKFQTCFSAPCLDLPNPPAPTLIFLKRKQGPVALPSLGASDAPGHL